MIFSDQNANFLYYLLHSLQFTSILYENQKILFNMKFYFTWKHKKTWI